MRDDVARSGADLDALRAVVVGGPGVVARFPGIVCVAGAGDATAVRALLDRCAAAAGQAPGRPLGRSLARWLAGPDAPGDDLVFGTVAAADDRIAVFLYGGASVHLPGRTVAGADAAAWTDRLLPRPDGPVLLAVDGTDVPPDVGDRVHDLRTGVVPGAAVALLSPGAAPGLPGTGEHAVADPAPAQAAPQAPRRSALIHGHADADAGRRPPLDDGGARRGEPAGRPPGPPHPAEPQARGYLCARGHLNDPRSHFCVLCGIRMNERTGVLTVGRRPPLGLLVFDDGSTYTVDGEYVVGRSPEEDRRVRDGELRALIVDDPGGTVSRVHAEIRVHDWDVVLHDNGSRNGTFVAPPGAPAWERVPERRNLPLLPGTRVRLGRHRTFVFESPSGVR